MRTKRLFGAAAAATIAAIAPLSAPIAAAAETAGVGTGTVSATVLSVEVGEAGNILSVRVLGDDGSSTTDPSNGAPSSSTNLRPLTISSQTVPALNFASPGVSTSSTGAEDSESVSPALPADVPTVSGSLAATLSSIVDSAGARSGLDATLTNVGVAGGLLSIPSGGAGLDTNAASTSASASRLISIPSIEVLNLGAVLEALGLPLEALDLSTLFGLLDTLGIPLGDITDPSAVIEEVNGAVDYLQTLPAGTELTPDICGTVDGLLGELGGLTGTVGINDEVEDVVNTVEEGTGTVIDTVPDTGTPVDDVLGSLSAQALPVSCDAILGTVNQLIDDLQDIVGDLLGSALSLLDDTALLSVSGIEVGLVASATNAVETSVADVTGTVGEVKVGNLAVPGVSGLDLTSATDVLAGAADTITAAVGSVLSLVNADLANLVDVDVLDIQELVTTEGAYTKATASVTALRATLNPAGLLGAAAIDLNGTVGAALDEIGRTAPVLSPVMTQLEAALGGLDVLTAPTTITVGQLTSASTFRALAAGESTPVGSDLPRTGTNAAVPAMAAVLLAGVALGIRRWVAAVVTD